MDSIYAMRMPVVVNKQIILLDNRTIAAATLLRLFSFDKAWTVAALNRNIGLIGGSRMHCFAVEDLNNITSYLKLVHPGWFAKVHDIYTKLTKDHAHKYKEVKKACVFIWCGGLHRMTFYNESLTPGQLLGTMNAIIEAACFFFGGPEHRPAAENAVAVSQSFDKYRVSRWKAADGCARYGAVFPVRHQYEGDIDIDKEAFSQLTPTASLVDVSPLTGRGRIEDLSESLITPWEIIDVFSSPLIAGSIPMLPLRHRFPAKYGIPHGARAIRELLLPLYYPPPTALLLQFTVFRELVYWATSSGEDDYLSEQLTVLSEQHLCLSQCLYPLSNKIYVSKKQLSCLTMHFTYMAKSTLYHDVCDLYSRSCDLQKKLVDPSPPLQDKITQLNRFWIQYQRVSEQFDHVRRKFDQPFPEHVCNVCRLRDEFPKFPSPLSYEELLGCGERGLPRPTGPSENSHGGYCLTSEQLKKLIRSMSTDSDFQKAEAVAEEQVDTAPVSTTKDQDPPVAATQSEENFDTAPTSLAVYPDLLVAAIQFEEQIGMAPTGITRASDFREADTKPEEKVDMDPTSTTRAPDPRGTDSQLEGQGDKPGTSMETTRNPELDQEIIDTLDPLLAGNDPQLATMWNVDSVDFSEHYPLPPGYSRVVDSAPVSYECGNHDRPEAPDTAPKRPAKRRKRTDGAASSSTGI